MRHIKSERLKKLEAELQDLQQWLKLGLVPKKDVEKHKEEIQAVQLKIEDEKERIQLLKESGDAEEFVAPKRPQQGRVAYNEMPTIPDIDMPEGGSLGDTHFDLETDSGGDEGADEEKEEGEAEGDEGEEEGDQDSFFDDRNRWRRGGIIDPDANDW